MAPNIAPSMPRCDCEPCCPGVGFAIPPNQFHARGTTVSEARVPGNFFSERRLRRNSRSRSDAFGGYHPGNSGEIVRDADVGPTGLGVEHFADSVGRIVTELEDQNCAGPKLRAGLLDQPIVDLHAGWASEKRGARFVVADLRWEGASVPVRDVGRIADDQVETGSRPAGVWRQDGNAL